MKTNVLPPVIENLLTCCYNAQGAYQILKDAGLAKELAGFDHCLASLNKAIKAAEQHKKQLEQDDLISLFVVSAGELEVGIRPEQIEIKIPRLYIQANAAPHSQGAHDFLRKEIKELFADACSTLFETSVGAIYFEDECPDCGKILNDVGKCETKDCLNSRWINFAKALNGKS